MSWKSLGFAVLTATLSVSAFQQVAAARPAVVVTEDPNGFVNVRSGPSVQYEIEQCASNGTAVSTVRGVKGKDGYTWYSVLLSEEMIGGYIREDFLRFVSSIDEGNAWNGRCGKALEPGMYYGGGSRYISLARKGERICYSGSSVNAGVVRSTVASVHAVAGESGVYEIHNFQGARLEQKDTETLLFGEVRKPYERDGDGSAPSGNMLSCLNASDPFFEQTSGSSGSRMKPHWAK